MNLKVFDPLSHPAGTVLVVCLSIQEANRVITLRELRNRFTLDDNPAQVMRQFADWGWAERKAGSTTRSPNYGLTPEGMAQAHAACAAINVVKVSQMHAWETDHHVYGVPRGPDAGPLNLTQVKEWIRGYWREQVNQSRPPINAPEEVKAGWATGVERLNRQLSPYDPHKATRLSDIGSGTDKEDTVILSKARVRTRPL